jgi:hypothetical protein
MSNARFDSQAIDKAAAAIANARIGRRGSPAISNVLDILPPNLLAEVREDAEAALNTLPEDSDNG